MCLQWCHVTHQLIDNDLPCLHCPVETRFAHVQECCETCVHYVAREGAAPLCAVTRELLPNKGYCCHWNVVQEVGMVIVTSADVAPGLLAARGVQMVSELFDRSETAPDYDRLEEGAVLVGLDDLAVPYVYGHPADEWDDLLCQKQRSLLPWDYVYYPVQQRREQPERLPHKAGVEAQTEVKS